MAASIGGGHIFIGSAAEGGIEVSHGYIIPDLHEMRSRAAGLGMKNTEGMEVFMAEANWLFLHGFDPENGHLVRFDRDFDDYTSVSRVEEVLNDWWQIVIVDDEDLAKRFPGV